MTFGVPLRHGLVMRFGIGVGLVLADPNFFAPFVGNARLASIG